MKALFIPEEERAYTIELIAETQEEREMLLKYWNCENFAVTCEEWREICG